MSIPNRLPSFSVVVEWENVRLSEAVLAQQMLAELARQTAELAEQTSPPPEMLLMYSRDAFDPAPVQAMLAAAFGPEHPVQPRMVPTEGLEYYTQKNAGARAAAREVVVFLDSDVVPEPGWLAGLMQAMRDPEVAVVGGSTHVTPKGIYGKAFSLFWFFPPRDAGAEGLRKREMFFANNVAFRRDLFLSTGFPDTGQLRGQCCVLAQQLRHDGVDIYHNAGSRVAHPPPNGLVHFVRRGLSAGHDYAVELPAGSPVLRSAYWRLRASLKDSARRIQEGRQSVGLSQPGAAAAIGIAATYHLLTFAGELVTHRAPNLIPKYSPV